jgi:hypothetical protein
MSVQYTDFCGLYNQNNNGIEGNPEAVAETASMESTCVDENNSHVLLPITN